MGLQIRAIEPDEFEEMRRSMGLVFGFDPPEGEGRFLRLLPLERIRCGFEDGRMISTSGAFDLEMTVPGAQIRCGGTTVVSVAPTHRRRGALREMMRSHLDDVKEHEEPIAALWASTAPYTADSDTGAPRFATRSSSIATMSIGAGSPLSLLRCG